MHMKPLVPIVTGAAMGLMMLWMAHGALIDGTAPTALVVFALAHVAVIVGLGLATVWAAKFAPRFKKRLGKLHRPSLAHVGVMLGSAAVAAVTVHITLHGGL